MSILSVQILNDLLFFSSNETTKYKEEDIKYEDNLDFQTVDFDCSDAMSEPFLNWRSFLECFEGVGFLTFTPGAAAF